VGHEVRSRESSSTEELTRTERACARRRPAHISRSRARDERTVALVCQTPRIHLERRTTRFKAGNSLYFGFGPPRARPIIGLRGRGVRGSLIKNRQLWSLFVSARETTPDRLGFSMPELSDGALARRPTDPESGYSTGRHHGERSLISRTQASVRWGMRDWSGDQAKANVERREMRRASALSRQEIFSDDRWGKRASRLNTARLRCQLKVDSHAPRSIRHPGDLAVARPGLQSPSDGGPSGKTSSDRHALDCESA